MSCSCHDPEPKACCSCKHRYFPIMGLPKWGSCKKGRLQVVMELDGCPDREEENPPIAEEGVQDNGAMYVGEGVKTGIKTSITVEDTLNLLNEIIVLDPLAARSLVETRVSCNKKLEDHPTIQVQYHDDESPIVGLLGVLNGLFGIDKTGRGPITAVFGEDGDIRKFVCTPRVLFRARMG